jgi:hypothetical protein
MLIQMITQRLAFLVINWTSLIVYHPLLLWLISEDKHFRAIMKPIIFGETQLSSHASDRWGDLVNHLKGKL